MRTRNLSPKQTTKREMYHFISSRKILSSFYPDTNFINKVGHLIMSDFLEIMIGIFF